ATKILGFGLGLSWTLLPFIFSIMVWILLLLLFSYSPGEVRHPPWLFYHFTKFGPVFSGHFSASTNTPKNTAFLTISSVQAKDEGDYYCYVG
uniref:Immunoglobulin V-set domain-containing protein n=1 Tax=Naja naja TaxID=35670 RepID=A0A8C6VRP1_NAJNA